MESGSPAVMLSFIPAFVQSASPSVHQSIQQSQRNPKGLQSLLLGFPGVQQSQLLVSLVFPWIPSPHHEKMPMLGKGTQATYSPHHVKVAGYRGPQEKEREIDQERQGETTASAATQIVGSLKLVTETNTTIGRLK